MDHPFYSYDNLSSIYDINDPRFHACWRRHESCQYCLQGDIPCSWCPFSSTCVPNPSIIPILSPMYSENICPLGYKERWELRSRPLGCNVSSITFLTSIVTIISTLVGVGLIIGIVYGGESVVRSVREGKGMPGGGRIRSILWKRDHGDGRAEGILQEEQGYGERRPLLG